MNKNRVFCLVVILLALVFILIGCGGRPTPTQVVQINPGARETEVYNTVVAQFTQAASAITPTSVIPPSPTIQSLTPTGTSTLLPPTPTNPPVEPTSTYQPTATLTPRLNSTPVRLWHDDFEAEKNWYTGSKEDSYTFEYQNGAYRIYNNLQNSIVWSTRGDTYMDVRLEVDAMKLKGPKTGYYGLICRFVDSKNYYALVINDDGSFGVAKMDKGKLGFIQEGDMPAKVLKAKDEYNRIRVDCIGSMLTLYVNGHLVVEVQDDSFASGDVGIGVGNSLDQAGIDALFDNFEIWQP